MPTPTPFVADPVLTAIAVNFQNPDASFIADAVMPRVPVPARSFKWTYFPPEDMFTVPDTLVGRKGRVPEIEATGEERTDSVDDHGIDDVVPQHDIDAAAALRAQGQSAFDPEARATEVLTHLLRVDRERRVAGIVQDPASYDAGKVQVLAGTDLWSDQANSDPIGVISAALDATFIMRPNVMAMGRIAWTALSTHPDIMKAINRTAGDRGRASRQSVAELFELSDVLVGDSYLNTAKPGQAAAFSRIWGNSVALIHRNSQASANGAMPSWGWTATFGQPMAGRIPEPRVGLDGAVRIRVGERVREVVSAPATGFLLQNVV